MTLGHAIIAPAAALRPAVDREEHGIALAAGARPRRGSASSVSARSARIPRRRNPRPAPTAGRPAAAERRARHRDPDGGSYSPRPVVQQQRRRPPLPGGMAAFEESGVAAGKRTAWPIRSCQRFAIGGAADRGRCAAPGRAAAADRRNMIFPRPKPWRAMTTWLRKAGPVAVERGRRFAFGRPAARATRPSPPRPALRDAGPVQRVQRPPLMPAPPD